MFVRVCEEIWHQNREREIRVEHGLSKDARSIDDGHGNNCISNGFVVSLKDRQERSNFESALFVLSIQEYEHANRNRLFHLNNLRVAFSV